jgi:hypothetical protein
MMVLHQRAAGGKSNTRDSARATYEGTLHGRFLLLARGAWIAFALVELVLFIAGIFAYATQLHTICTNTVHVTCNYWQPTPGNVRALAHLGISLDAYAATFLTIDILVSLIFGGIGVLIFWRKSDTGIGLFVSLVLVMDRDLALDSARRVLPITCTLQCLVLAAASVRCRIAPHLGHHTRYPGVSLRARL